MSNHEWFEVVRALIQLGQFDRALETLKRKLIVLLMNSNCKQETKTNVSAALCLAILAAYRGGRFEEGGAAKSLIKIF